ncbi:hypothetical protein CDD83_5135 [Cordyceps sp. RAO-2017]|nr:hypothetical protein CDD83_5135 [Cordyceps sp. RAO-2017]
MTVIDRALSDATNNDIFRDFAQELLQEDPVVGPRFLRGMLNWVQHTRDHPPRDMKFSTLTVYTDQRIRDFAVDFCDAAIMLTCNISLSAAEMEPLGLLQKLYITHFSLTNDLYSYDKEVREMQKHGSALLNGVKVPQDILEVSPRAARIILRGFLWDLEPQIDKEYVRLLDAAEIGSGQARFARGMIQTLAGNMFYSATTARYAAAAA